MPRAHRSLVAVLALTCVLARASASASVSDSRACFWSASASRCVPSARFVASHHLVHSPGATFLADVVAGLETCAAAGADAGSCDAASATCARATAFGADACVPSAAWGVRILHRCLVGPRAKVDPAIVELLDLASTCLARTPRGESACADGKIGLDAECAWVDASSSDSGGSGDDSPSFSSASFCAPSPVAAAKSALGIPAFAALAVAASACESKSDTSPAACEGEPYCAWSYESLDSDAGACVADPVEALKTSTRSTAIRAALGAMSRCRLSGEEARGSHASAKALCDGKAAPGNACVFGPKSKSTNVFPEDFGGDGGDFTGGEWVPSEAGESPAEESQPHQCYATYDALMDAVAPEIGLSPGAGESGGAGECATLGPLFDALRRCASAGADAALCASAGPTCAFVALGTAAGSSGSGSPSFCAIDPTKAFEAFAPDARDADPIEAMRAVCEAAAGEDACAVAAAEAAAAGASAARADGDATDGGRETRGASAEARAGAIFVLFCFGAFGFCVAPFAAYANWLKRRGEDVCDKLPPAFGAFVPSALRPDRGGFDDSEFRYVAFEEERELQHPGDEA